MTIDEADAIIAELNICFPSKQLVVEEVKRWEANLNEFNFEDARRAVKHIEETSKFWPSWAEFRESILPLHKQRLWDQNDRKERELRALEPVLTEEDRERTKAIIAEIRAKLSGKK